MQAPVAVSPQRPAYGAQATPAGFGYPQAVPAFPQFNYRGQVKGAWRRDWTAWALILAGPVAILGLIIAPLVTSLASTARPCSSEGCSRYPSP